MRRILIIIAVLGLLLVPATAEAVSWIPLVPCGSTGQDSCTPCHLFQTAKNLIDLVLYGITGPIAAFMIVLAGGMMLLGGGNPAMFSQGKTMLTNTLVGVLIILLSWVLTNFLIKSLIRGGQGDNWNEFTCPKGLSTIMPLETALPTGGPQPNVPAPKQLVPKYIGATVAGSTFTKYNRDRACTTTSGGGAAPGTCPKLAPILGGVSNRKLVESIMLHESSCRVNPPPSGAGAYGLMQMKPETANRFRDGCDVTEEIRDTEGNVIEKREVSITPGWLMSAANAEKIVCVAANFIESLKGACGSEPLHIAAGYNGGELACARSRDCADMESAAGGGPMRRWECPWNNRDHTDPNRGYVETRNYAPKVAACAR